jgi:hypothetical protein
LAELRRPQSRLRGEMAGKHKEGNEHPGHLYHLLRDGLVDDALNR